MGDATATHTMSGTSVLLSRLVGPGKCNIDELG